MINLAVIGYVPPPSFGHPETFLKNLQANPTKQPLFLYTDYIWEKSYPIENCTWLKLRQSPEITKGCISPEHRNKTWIVNNTVFLTGLSLARQRGYSHILYLEEDCRVRCKFWDSPVWEEYFACKHPLVCAGSLVVYNPSNAGSDALKRWAECVSINLKRNHPIPTYGFRGASESFPSAIFPNGALGIYDVGWLWQLLEHVYIGGGKGIDPKVLAGMFAWDFYLGQLIWKEFGLNSYDVVEHLSTIFSSYGNVLTTEEERLKMLETGTVMAVHQVKS